MTHCHAVLFCVAPYLDIEGYSAVLGLATWAWLLRELFARPDHFTWLRQCEFLPIPLVSGPDRRPIQLDVRPQMWSTFQSRGDCRLDLYDPVIYHVNNARSWVWHWPDFIWLMTRAHLPRIRFAKLEHAVTLCTAVWALVEYHCEADDDPRAIRPAALKT